MAKSYAQMERVQKELRELKFMDKVAPIMTGTIVGLLLVLLIVVILVVK